MKEPAILSKNSGEDGPTLTVVLADEVSELRLSADCGPVKVALAPQL